MVVMGGFDNFPHVTKAVYARKVGNKQGVQVKWSKWERLADLPRPITHMAQAVDPVDQHIFCGVGGYLGKHPGRSVSDAYCYDFQKNKWTHLPKLPAPRAGGGLVFYRKYGKRELIFAGGVHRKFDSLCCHQDHGTTWSLDLNNVKAGWKNHYRNMPDPRNHMGAIESCGRYFWVGGQHKEEEAWGDRKSVSEYIPHQKRWVKSKELPIAIGHISASVMPYKCGILVVGGVKLGGGRLKTVYWYSSYSNKWFLLGKTQTQAATPVCGIFETWKGDPLVCATGGNWGDRDKIQYNILYY